MTDEQKDKRDLELGYDGEVEGLPLPEATLANEQVLYCDTCGASNRVKASFCRECGRSLLEQEIEMLGIPDANENKHKPNLGEKRKPGSQALQAEGLTVRLASWVYLIATVFVSLITFNITAIIILATGVAMLEMLRRHIGPVKSEIQGGLMAILATFFLMNIIALALRSTMLVFIFVMLWMGAEGWYRSRNRLQQ
jgi:ribosomal protein L40E